MSATGVTTVRHLRVLLADEDEEALQRFAEILTGLGHDVTPFAVSVQEAVELIAREDPDLAMVVVHHDDEHGLALISETVEYASGPVIAHVRGADHPDLVARAAEMGISAYVESDAPQALQAAIEVALRRYRETTRLEEKVEQLQSALERRAVIERAKGIVMERQSLDEQRAFALLREHARSRSRPVVEVAQAVVDGHALLPPRP